MLAETESYEENYYQAIAKCHQMLSLESNFWYILPSKTIWDISFP